MTKKLYHNEIVKRLREWIDQDKENFPNGTIYTTFEDIPELREKIAQKQMTVDLRYSVDLIHAEKKQEKEDPKEEQKGPKIEEEGVKDVFYYTLFLVFTGSISGSEKSKVSGISDLLRERLLFYQYYFSSISEPKYIRIILVVPSDTDIASEAKSEVFEEYRIGLWKIDIEKGGLKKEVDAAFFRERMSEAFKVSVNKPQDMGEAIKDISEEIKVEETVLIKAIEEKAGDFATFFEQYILEAVEAISEIPSEQIGKRYIDRQLIDGVLELHNIPCLTECRDLVHDHLSDKNDDYKFAGECFRKLWHNTFGIGFPTTQGDFEKFLQIFFPQYREHFVHQFQVFLFGMIILDYLLEDPSILFENGGSQEEKENLLKGWLLSSSIHDFTYPLQKYDKWSEDFFEQQLGIDNPPRFLDLSGIYVEKTFLSRVELLLSELEKDLAKAEPLEKAGFLNEIRRFIYYEIAEKKNHGLMGSSYLLKKFEKKGSDELSKIVLPAAVASAIHDNEVWQTLSGQVDNDPRNECEYICKILGITSNEDIEKVLVSKLSKKDKNNRIADEIRRMKKVEKAEWVSNTYIDINNILEKKTLPALSLKSQPLAFLLILCDNLQDFERPSENVKWKGIMEALDVRLGHIIPDIGSKKITIQIYLNDVQEGYGWMNEKQEILNKIKNLLKSPDIEFVIEYLERGSKNRKMHCIIH